MQQKYKVVIPQDKVQEILENARVEEVVGEFVSLKKRGVNMIGNCPFHNEKTPSFTVSPVKGIYKCFGCGASGNAVNFVMQHEHYTYPEALRWLAKKYNVEVLEAEQTPEEIKTMGERESLMNLSAFAQKYFSETIYHNEDAKAIAYSYLIERGITDASIKKFELGYCLDKHHAFTEYATKHAYKSKYLVDSGLSSQKGDQIYDKFRGRVLFPIHNLSGRVIGFGGRILTNEKNRPKYLNSPESLIYNKSKVLYGIFFAKNSISRSDNCYLVEGYTDVISMHQAGIENVVASSGTSLTVDQVKLIKRYTPNITILYDGDPAGIKASFRGIDMILEEGMNVKVVLFPEGEDPDSYARNHPSSETQKYIQDSAVDFIKFKSSILLKDSGNDPIKRAGLTRDILNSVSLIPDLLTRSVYVKECSQLLEINEDTLFTELNKILDTKQNKQKPSRFAPEPPPEDLFFPPEEEEGKVVRIEPKGKIETPKHEEEAIRFLISYGTYILSLPAQDEFGKEITADISVAEYMLGEFLEDEIVISAPEIAKIYAEYVGEFNKGTIPSEKFFLNHPDPDISKVVIQLLFEKETLLEGWNSKGIFINTEKDDLRKTIDRFLLSYKSFYLKQNIRELEAKLKNINGHLKEPNNINIMMEILSELTTLKEIHGEINKKLDRSTPSN
ncbi:MAG: DNA primase [Bacteroidales bacterium]|nr:DNA primase [Bacteroidales bacterium]